MALLEIQDFCLEFQVGNRWVRAVDEVSLTLDSGKTLCLVGESGCGKSVSALSIARLIPTPPARYSGGSIRLQGREVLTMPPAELRSIRGGVVSYIFQEPSASLNPVFRIGAQIMEMLKLHQPALARKDEVIRLLGLVGIPAPQERFQSYPFELSGGMQQRVMIAMALASRPALLVADEPTTALDVTIQAQILELLKRVKEQLGMAILLITHNLGIVAEMADQVGVMYCGQIVEYGPAEVALKRAAHPYTVALLASTPPLSGTRNRLSTISGNVPPLSAYPPGCRFYDRCPSARPECSTQPPPLREIAPGHWVRCLYATEAAQ